MLPPDLVGELGEPGLGVSDQGHAGLIVLADLVRVDIDVEQRLARLQPPVPPERSPLAKTRADGEQDVHAALEEVPLRERRAGVAEGAHGKAMVLGEHALALGRRRDRDVEHLGDHADLVGRVRQDRAVSGQDHGPSRAEKVQGRLLDRLPVVRARPVHGPAHLDRILYRLLLHVGGQAQMDRTRPPADRHPERLVPDGRNAVGPEREDAVARHLLEDVDDIDALRAGFLERASPEGLRRDLPRQHDDRNRVRIRAGDSREEVGGAGARRRHARAQPAAGARVAVGHERGPGLVLRHDELNLAPDGRGEQGEDGSTDHAEHVPDARFTEGVDQILGDLALRARRTTRLR